MVHCMFTYWTCLNETILISTQNIVHFHDKIKKRIPKIYLDICFLYYYKNFLGTVKAMVNKPLVLESLKFY